MASMIGPAIRLPIGIVPPNAMNHSGIAEARSLSARFCCITDANAVADMK